jgi:hypothetical protein
MTIKQFLQCYPARITMYDRWLCLGNDPEYDNEAEFTVYERKSYARKTKTIYHGFNESKAIEALINNIEI